MAQEHVTPLIPVRERLQFDQAGLDRYIRKTLGDFSGDMTVRMFDSGQSNPTYLVTAGDRQYVLRRKPPGEILASAHQVDREYRVMTALRDSDVPVPRTYAQCEDPQVIGTAFYLMEYVPGRVIIDPTMPGLSREHRTILHQELMRVMAALHRVDYQAVGLGDFGRPGNYFARQVSRWTRQYRASETERIEVMERLIEWLPAHTPEADETAIVHGDLRFHNTIIHPTEPRILAVLDWELSTLGHPLADLGLMARTWRLPLALGGMADADLPALGIPSEEEMLADYCWRTGRDRIEHWPFYMAFNLFRSAAIYQGIMGRALAGNASSDRGLTYGARVRGLAEGAWQIAEEAGSRP